MKFLITVFFMVSSLYLGAQETFDLQKESSLTISGTSTIHDWTVQAQELEGKMTVANDAPNNIEFNVAVEGIKSERGPTMDNKMYDALKKDDHPKINFNLKEIKDASILVGTLTIAGQSRLAEIPLKLDSFENGFQLTGKYGIVLKDFGIEPPTAMFGQIVVGDKVEVNFDLKFSKG